MVDRLAEIKAIFGIDALADMAIAAPSEELENVIGWLIAEVERLRALLPARPPVACSICGETSLEILSDGWCTGCDEDARFARDA